MCIDSLISNFVNRYMKLALKCFYSFIPFSHSLKQPMMRFGVIPNHNTPYSVSECRSLMKTLVCGVKTITWGTLNCKAYGGGMFIQNLFTSKLSLRAHLFAKFIAEIVQFIKVSLQTYFYI